MEPFLLAPLVPLLPSGGHRCGIDLLALICKQFSSLSQQLSPEMLNATQQR